jgi:MFS family permease
MRRVSGFVLTLLGAFLLLLAVLLRFWVTPANLKDPLNAYKVAHLTGTGAYINRSTGQEVPGVDVEVTTTTQGDVSAGNSGTAVYNIFSSVQDVTNHRAISYYEYREAFNRKTSQIVSCCGEFVTDPAGNHVSVPMSGLGPTFPIGTQQQTYVIFDPAPAKPEPIRYAGTGTVDGIGVYRFVEHVTSVPFGAPEVVSATFAGLPGTGNVTLHEYYTATNTYWVDPETGAPLDTAQDQQVSLGTSAADTRLVASRLTLAETPATVSDVVNTDIHYRNEINLVKNLLPLIGLIVGLVLIAVGLLFVRYGAEGAEDEFRWLWRRQLDIYPENGPRVVYLAITVLATVTLYYELYVGGSVSTEILVYFHMSFTFYVVALAFGNLLGAFGSLFAGLADRLGRTNLVVFGLLLTGIFTAYVLPAATNKWEFIIEFFVVGIIEGIALVATPALIRDFSPQVGRATAMGFWTAGPVLGSLVVTVVASNTLPAVVPTALWQHEFHICGAVGLIVFAITLFGLRELSPQIRDQLMVTMRDRILVEARAKGLDVAAMLHKPFRQLFKVDVVVSAIAVSMMLLIYYTAVAFGLIYLATVFGFSTKNANGLLNWNWGFNVIAVILVGMLSDLVRVRKPFMVIGGVGAAIMTLIYLEQAGHHPGYYTLALILAMLSLFVGIAYTPWLASFTETVEARNPALTATGLAIWGWIIRVVVFAAFLITPHVITSVSPLVDYGQTAQAYQAQYPSQIAFAQGHPQIVATAQKYKSQLLIEQSLSADFAVLQAHQALFTKLATYSNPASIPPKLLTQAIAAAGGGAKGLNILLSIQAHKADIQKVAAVQSQLLPLQPYAAQLTALSKVPPSVLSFLQAHGATVLAAQARAPNEWKRWYWVCFGGIIFFLLCIPLLHGRWRPSDARRDEEEHEAVTQAELAKLNA